jgi:diadenosine tetraphosphate (Ap4A) HIT family hydrolase
MTITSSQKENEPCIYCSNPEIKARLIVENNLAWTFLTNIPITPGHILISPKRCVRRFDELTIEERLAIFELADKIMSIQKVSFGAEGFNCVWNQEKLAGQSVPHFHLHIIPRKKGDTGLLGYDPRSMLYRTGDREPTSEEDLKKSREIILSRLNEIS